MKRHLDKKFMQWCMECDPNVTIDAGSSHVPMNISFSNRCRLNDAMFAQWASVFGKLVYLDLSNSQVSIDSIRMLATSTTLQWLAVGVNLNAEDLDRLFHNPALKTLKMPISEQDRERTLPEWSDCFQVTLTICRTPNR